MRCTFIDWKQAYSRQSHILGVQSFIKNGVRPSLIPLLTSYFQSREMKVKWHSTFSEPRQMPGSGAMGSFLGNHEFDSQTNNNAECIPEEDRFKFVDDLSCLEIINLVNIGLCSLNVKHSVPNDLPLHGQFVDSSNLKSQGYIDKINLWSENQQMVISEKKTKAMIVNFTQNYQFHTRLNLKKNNVQVVNQMKILGTVVTDQLSWSENCTILVKKVNARMQLLRKVWGFGSSIEDMVHLWKVYCLSVLEQCAVVWGGMLTEENKQDLERTQKSFVKLVLEENYTTYLNSLKSLGLETLETRRKNLTLKFAKTSLADGHFSDLIKKKAQKNGSATRNKEYYNVTFAHTERYKKSPILTMQRLLNEDKQKET